MIPRNRASGPPLRRPPQISDTSRTIRLVRDPVQRQLAVFLWISTAFPVWWKRPAHRAMMDRTFSRIIAEEGHE